MRITGSLIVVLLACLAPAARGQTMNFESLACEGARYVDIGNHYEEAGFQLDQGQNENWQFRVPCNATRQYAGSTTLYNNTPDGLIRLTNIEGKAFTITQIKIAELNGPGAVGVDFVGTQSNGDVVRHNIRTDGRGPGGGLQTFEFPDSFSGLTSVEWRQVSPYHQFDDLELSAGSACTYAVKKAKAKGGCDSCPPRGGDFRTEAECENAKDCAKKVKTTIACPGGGNGTCKVKAKGRRCE